MNGPSLQVLTVTEHDDGSCDVTVSEWYRGTSVPFSDTLVDVPIESDDPELTDELATLAGWIEHMHDEHAQYLDAMHAAGYEDGMEFEAWQRNSGTRAPASMSDRQAATAIARTFGTRVRPSIASRWAGAL